MNFLYKLTKSGIIFFYIICLISCISQLSFGHTQELGLPYIQQVRPVNHTGIYKFQSVAQDSKGFLYIGGYNGILRYDGYCWEKINIPGEISVASNRNGMIWAGGDHSFGIIDYLEDGSMHFTDLLTTSKDSITGFGQVRGIMPLHDGFLIHTSTNLFTCYEEIIRPVNIAVTPEYIVQVDDTIFLYINDYGLYIFLNGETSHVVKSDYLADLHVEGMFPLGDTLLIYTSKGGFQIYYHGLFEKYHTSIDSFVAKNGYSDGIYCNHRSLVISSENAGLAIYNQERDQIQYLRTDAGLTDSRINKLFADKSGNIWIIHDEALTRMEWPSSASYFDARNGLDGHIRSVIRHNGELYVSTAQGIYLLKSPPGQDRNNRNDIFIKLKDTDYDCSSLLSTDDLLLVPGSSGILQIDRQGVKLIFPEEVNVLCQSQFYPGTFLAGTSRGLVVLNQSENKWTSLAVLPDLTYPVMDIAESDDGFLWLSTLFNGLYRLSLSTGYQSVTEYTHLGTAEGLPSDNQPVKFIHASNRLIFITNHGLYHYHHSENRFIPYSVLNPPFLSGSSSVIPLAEDYENNLWIKIADSDLNIVQLWKACFSAPDQYELIQINLNRINKMYIQSVYTESDGAVWICNNDQLIRIDSSFQTGKSFDFQTYISKIIVNNSLFFTPEPFSTKKEYEPESKPFRIPYSKNNIHFTFISIDLSNQDGELYQYWLNGLDDDWSKWSSSNQVSFMNLPPGKYIFQVKSMNAANLISTIDHFNFRIAVPLYLTWWAILIYLFFILIGLYIFQKWRNYRILQERYRLEEIIQERTEALIKEKEKSENLLANILPKNTADELKSTGKATSSKFKMATVLFADIQGFTKIAEQMNPDKLIDELDRFYFQFDSVVEKYNIEKIKTIGDAYMAAGGIPIKNRTNPVEVVLAALQMQHFMKDLKKTRADIWDLRIGIHTGSVIAGVVGQKKFSYDIWGDTVNTASRMESSGEIGKVNISATTYELVKDFFECNYRGKMPVKYKGDIEMYFVKGLKPELQADNEVTPNDEFEIRLQVLRLLDLEEFVIQQLEKELPENLYYHNAGHTFHVYTQVELLGRSENVTATDLLLLRSAALLHDIGYIDTVEGHEARSVELSREILPTYRYKEEQIDKICKLILATKMPPKPENLLEKIICDANLDHLGRVDFLIQSDKLFQEYRTLNKVKSKKEWNESQANFLKNHEFFTNAARRLCEVSKADQINNIMQFS